MSPENAHKLIRIYMGGLILGGNTLYMLSCFLKQFALVGKGLIKYLAARGCGGARPNPSIIGARSSCVSCRYLHPLCTVCTTIAPRVLHFSAVHLVAIWTLWPTPCIAVLMDYKFADGVHVFVDPAHLTGWESCVWECIILQNRDLVLAGTILIVRTQMLPNLYFSIHMIACPNWC